MVLCYLRVVYPAYRVVLHIYGVRINQFTDQFTGIMRCEGRGTQWRFPPKCIKHTF